MKAIDSLNVKVGQNVVVGIPEDTLLQASIWMYLIPLLGLVGGAIIPSIWGGESGIAVIFSIIGFTGQATAFAGCGRHTWHTIVQKA